MNKLPKVLVIEDEDSIRRFTKINLERSGFEVLEASSGAEGLAKINSEQPQLVVLDLMLPDIDGYAICQKVRELFPQIAIIMLTARGQDMDRVMGLELGADDYMVKPFNPLELVARIRSVLRRAKIESPKEKEVLFSGPFLLDVMAQKLYKADQEISLTHREFLLMELFMHNANKAFTRDEILNRIWGKNYFGDMKTVDVHMRRLREKIGNNPSSPNFIVTVWGVGYRFSGGELREY